MIDKDKQLFGFLNLRSLLTFVLSVGIFAVISWAYFYPNDLNGDELQQHDMVQGMANGQEVSQYQQQTGEKSWWTDALFGGMPTFQISPSYESTPMLSWVEKVYSLGFMNPVGWVFIMMLGFFILLLAFKVRWYLAVLGAIGYAFSSYFFIIIGAGHIWKLLVLAYVPPTIAGIVWAYRGKVLGGAALAALFGALQLMSNHPQMTYYFAFVIVALMIAYFIIAFREKTLKQWGIATGALAVAALLAVGANAPHLYFNNKYQAETMRGGPSELTPPESGEKADANEHTGGLDRSYITAWSYGEDETFSLLIPNIKGGATTKLVKGQTQGEAAFRSLDKTDKGQDLIALNPDRVNINANQSYNVTQDVLKSTPQYFGSQPMTNGPVYVGIIIFALFLVGCVVVKGPVKWALLAVTILSVVLSWGHNFPWVTNAFIDYFPLYNKFRTPASILVIAEFTMPLMAVLALQEMLENHDNFLKNHAKALYICFGVCAFFCLFFAMFPGVFGAFSAQEREADALAKQINQYLASFPNVTAQDVNNMVNNELAAIKEARLSLVRADALRSLLVLVIGFGIVFGYLRGWLKVNKTVVTLLIAAVVLVDMYSVNKRYLSEESFIPFAELQKTSALKATAADNLILEDKSHYRVLYLPDVGYSTAEPSYYHKTIGGYHAAKLQRYQDLIDRKLSIGNQQIINELKQGRYPEMSNYPVFNMLNAKYLLFGETEDAVLENPEALGNAWFVDTLAYVDNADEEMAFLDKFDPSREAVADKKFENVLGVAAPKAAGDTIYLTEYKPNQITYKSHSAGDRLAVFSEIYFPWGWHVTIDGKEVESGMGRVNYVLRAVQIPAGYHEIVFSFLPTEVKKADTLAKYCIAGIFLLIIGALVMMFIQSRRKKEKNK